MMEDMASQYAMRRPCLSLGTRLRKVIEYRPLTSPDRPVQSSEFILVKNDKLTRKALTEPLPANSGPYRYTIPPPHPLNMHPLVHVTTSGPT